VAGSPENVLERHGISVGDAKKISESLAKFDFGSAMAGVTSRMIEAFSVSGTPSDCRSRVDELLKTV